MVFIAKTADVDSRARIEEDARVEGYATILVGTVLEGSAVVKDDAEVSWVAMSGSARVEGSSKIDGGTVVGSARVSGSAIVIYSDLRDSIIIEGKASAITSEMSGNARVSGNARIENTSVRNSSEIYGDAELNNIEVNDSSRIFGNARLVSVVDYVYLKGNCKFGGNANFDNLFNFEDFVAKYGADKVSRYKYGFVLTDVWDMG